MERISEVLSDIAERGGEEGKNGNECPEERREGYVHFSVKL
jgi:hypothetical protein